MPVLLKPTTGVRTYRTASTSSSENGVVVFAVTTTIFTKRQSVPSDSKNIAIGYGRAR